MKRYLLVVLLLLLATPLLASHIVGGEFEISHILGNQYRVRLILYFDVLNGAPGARDNIVNARIFRKRDNFIVRNVDLFQGETSRISYTQPECSSGEIVTDRIIYETTIVMTAEQYGDAGGYYISWERCCRNYTISNIFSDNPQSGGNFAGQTFYLEFPPVAKNGEPFINSTPRLFPPLNDYACPNRPYYVDFAGVDDDGDSLVYALIDPLNTFAPLATPIGDYPNPGPYNTVRWRPPFSSTNIIGGNPDLNISRDGFLTVTPRFAGLYVFAVRCEEYRDGEKIGEVRRDFQMLVLDGCPVAEPPQILGKKLTETSFTYDENMTVSFANTVSNDDRCIVVQVSDPDALKADDGFTERISIRAVPLGIRGSTGIKLPAVTNAVLTNGSVKEFTICFDQCPPVRGPYQIGIVAYDDACSLPLSDTLKVMVNVEPPPNTKPRFITADKDTLLREGAPMRTWPIQAVDDNGDRMSMFILPDNFSLSSVGMNWQLKPQAGNLLESVLTWDPKCNMYDFTRKQVFNLTFLVDDNDFCAYKDYDTLKYVLRIQLPGNARPTITSDIPSAQLRNGFSKEIFESIGFQVFGSDADNDFIELEARPVGFELATYGIGFENKSGNGNVQSPFTWELLCNKFDLAERDSFLIDFVVVDRLNLCRFNQSDSLRVAFKIKPPVNKIPQITAVSTNPALPFRDNEQLVMLGQPIDLTLTALDANRSPLDSVRIELIEASGSVPPLGYTFTAAQGLGSAQTTFSWEPDCSIFVNQDYENDYLFSFRAVDQRCRLSDADTVTVRLTIRDVDGSDTNFLPPNIITPNGDGCNDYFAMEGFDASPCSGEGAPLLVNLPNDNCAGRFASIRIYNRWGNVMFESRERNFRWYAKGEAAGVYFYTLTYTNNEYKGTITVRN